MRTQVRWVIAAVFLVTASARADTRADVRVSADALWLWGTPALHGFTDSVDLGTMKDRQLFGATLEVGTWSAGAFGVSWFALSYAAASAWAVTTVNKHVAGAVPQVLTQAQANLVIVRLPAPRLRLRHDRLVLIGQATLGGRFGQVSQGGTGAAPAELMLPVRAALAVHLSRRMAAEVGFELLHSLATGASSGMVSAGVRWFE